MLKMSHLYIGVMRQEYRSMVTAYKLRIGTGEPSRIKLVLTVAGEFSIRVKERVKRGRAAMCCRGY